MQLEDTRQLFTASRSSWPILVMLYQLGEPVTLTELSRKVKMNKSTVSRQLDLLEAQNLKLISIEREPREEGGHRLKKTALTTDGFSFIDFILKLGERPVKEKQHLIPVTEEAVSAIERVLNGKTLESREAAWLELNKYATKMRLWEHEKIWSIIEPRLLDNKPGDHFNESLSIYKKMLAGALEEDGEKNAVAIRAKKKHFERLVDIAKTSDEVWIERKSSIIDLFRYMMKEDQQLDLFWKIWEEGVREISDKEKYQSFLITLDPHLMTTNPEMLKKILDRLYILLEDENEIVRQRASDMHRRMFACQDTALR